MTMILIFIVALALGLVYASFFEWSLHKYLMHSDRWMSYPHRAHQLEHHEYFKADGSYFLADETHPAEHRDHLTFAWWNAPLLVVLHAPLFALAAWIGGAAAAAGVFGALLAYYALYETLHYYMHVPKDRWVERTAWFGFIQEHHRLHHVYFQRNLNVVFPIADYLLGTRVPLPSDDFFDKLEQIRQRKMQRMAEGLQAAAPVPAA